MKTVLFLILFATLALASQAQNIAINNNALPPHNSAMLDVNSSSKGVLIPRISLSGTNDNATIPSAATSLLVYNTTTAGNGDQSVSPGFYFWDGNRWQKILSENNFSGWSTAGNAGTNPASHFIGTTDNTSLLFKVNNQKAGHIDLASFNTFFGYGAGKTNTTGYGITAVGINALANNTTGNDNIAIGEAALFANLTGFRNLAIGKFSLQHGTQSAYNIAIGNFALRENTTGYGNTAVGYNSLRNNTGGIDNVALGESTLSNNTTGNYNVALGKHSLSVNTRGSLNLAIGDRATTGYDTLTNASAIGARAQVDCNNCLVLGSVQGYNFSAGDVNVGIGTTSPSQPLSFGSRVGGKISLYKAGNAHYGIGVQNRQFQLYTDEEASDIVFGWGSSASFTESVRIKNNKRLGIGTTDPQASLDVLRTSSTTANFRGSVHSSHFNFGNEEHTYIRGGKDGGQVLLNDLNGLGNVGVGTSTPAYKLDVNGTIRHSGLVQNSDARLKTNIVPIQHAVSTLQHLNGYTYNWKDDTADKQLQSGLLAQEIEKVFPHLVKKDDKGILSVNYTGLIPVLLEAIKEQQKQIDYLMQQVKQKTTGSLTDH